MKIEQMFPSFVLMSEMEQGIFLEKYRLNRLNDMAKTSPIRTRKKAMSRPKKKVSDAEKKALKLLGLKIQDMEDLLS